MSRSIDEIELAEKCDAWVKGLCLVNYGMALTLIALKNFLIVRSKISADKLKLFTATNVNITEAKVFWAINQFQPSKLAV